MFLKPDYNLENVYKINATYSVIGQIWRHRTLVKKYTFNNYEDELSAAKTLTKNYQTKNTKRLCLVFLLYLNK